MPYCCARRTSPDSAAAGRASPAITRAEPTRQVRPRNLPHHIVVLPPTCALYAGPGSPDGHATPDAGHSRSELANRLEYLEEEDEADRQAGTDGECEYRLLAVAPGEQLERHDAQPAREMRCKEDDQRRLCYPHPGVVRPAQESLERRLALDHPRQCPEMCGQEKCEEQPGAAGNEKGPIGGMIARPPIDRLPSERTVHAKRAPAARQPAKATRTMKAPTAASRLAPRHVVVSRMVERNPIPPSMAAAGAERRYKRSPATLP